MEWYALIPAFEPELVLKNLVSELANYSFKIVVVDDGSGKEYDEIFSELKKNAVVLSNDVNHGKGYALKLGLKYIYDNNPNSVIVTIDADGQHLPKDAVKLCNEIEITSSDMVIGSRVITKKDPAKSRWGNMITRLVYRAVSGVKIYDTQSGLRAFKGDLIPVLMEISGDRYEYEMNVLLSMAKNKKKMTEVPIETIYFDKNNSVSHFDAVKDSIRIYRGILKFSVSSFLGFIVDYGLYSILLTVLGTKYVVASNIGARIVSACVNFTINKKLVFNSKGKFVNELVKYFGLAVFILCVNSIILAGLTKLGVNVYMAKIIVEIVMFFFSYTIQNSIVFKEEKQIC